MWKFYAKKSVILVSVSHGNSCFAFVNGSSQTIARRQLKFEIYSQNLLQSVSHWQQNQRQAGRGVGGLFLLNVFQQPTETVQYSTQNQNFTSSKSSTAKEYPVQLQLAVWQEHIANSSSMQQPARLAKCDGNYINRLIFYCVTGLPHWNEATCHHELKNKKVQADPTRFCPENTTPHPPELQYASPACSYF